MPEADILHASDALRVTRDTDTQWVPLGPGRMMKPIRFLSGDRGYVALMHVDPGTVIPRHRHTGEVHAINLSGRRELMNGEMVGPGDYVYEPAGNVDSWRAVGDEPAIVHIVVHGAVEYLADDGSVARRFSSAVMEEAYRAHCRAAGLPLADLVD